MGSLCSKIVAIIIAILVCTGMLCNAMRSYDTCCYLQDTGILETNNLADCIAKIDIAKIAEECGLSSYLGTQDYSYTPHEFNRCLDSRVEKYLSEHREQISTREGIRQIKHAAELMKKNYEKGYRWKNQNYKYEI